MGIAQRAHRQFRIGIEKGIEIRIPRTARNRSRLAGVLGRQRRDPAHHKGQAILLDPDLLGLHGLQRSAGQGAGAAGVDGLHQGTVVHANFLHFKISGDSRSGAAALHHAATAGLQGFLCFRTSRPAGASR